MRPYLRPYELQKLIAVCLVEGFVVIVSVVVGVVVVVNTGQEGHATVLLLILLKSDTPKPSLRCIFKIVQLEQNNDPFFRRGSLGLFLCLRYNLTYAKKNGDVA